MGFQLWLASIVGGLLGGLASAVILALLLRAFGRREAEKLLREQVDVLEGRLKALVVDQVFGQIGRILEKSERIGQIVKRVAEIVQLALGKPVVEPVDAGPPEPSPVALAAVHATLGSTLAQLGRAEEARRAFEEALRLDPVQAQALRGMKGLERR